MAAAAAVSLLSRFVADPVPASYHSRPPLPRQSDANAMRCVVVPANGDNYSYLLVDRQRKVAAAIDPADAPAMEAAAREEGVRIECILTTHHHGDHAGGNAALASLLMSAPPVM